MNNIIKYRSAELDRKTDCQLSKKYDTGMYVGSKKVAKKYAKIKGSKGIVEVIISGNARILEAENPIELYKNTFKNDWYRKTTLDNYVSELEQYRKAENNLLNNFKKDFDVISYKNDPKAPIGLENESTMVVLNEEVILNS